MFLARLKDTYLVKAGGPYETPGDDRPHPYPIWEIFDLGYLAMILIVLAFFYGFVRFLIIIPSLSRPLQGVLLVAVALFVRAVRRRYLMFA